MRILAILARVLFGLTFVVFGSNYFYGSCRSPRPSPTPGGPVPRSAGADQVSDGGQGAGNRRWGVGASGVVRAAGLTILTPIVVNIVLYHIFMLPTEPTSLVLTTTLMTLNSLLIVAYWPSFKGLLAPLPKD
jgi:hypothetical protein